MEEELPPINVSFMANLPYLKVDEPELQGAFEHADVIISLGGVDLGVLSQALPEGKPALAVIGPKDYFNANEFPNIKGLHATGVSFRKWLIAGLSGAPQLSAAKGFYLPEDEADSLLHSLPQANIFLSYAFPEGLRQSQTNPEHAMVAIDKYLYSKPPIYFFYAHPEVTIVEEFGDVLATGINGFFHAPPLEFI